MKNMVILRRIFRFQDILETLLATFAEGEFCVIVLPNLMG